jgi:fluoride exporter
LNFIFGGYNKMLKILYVGVGGFIGASLRYMVSIYSPKLFGTQLPYGTLLVNVLGGILIGFIMEMCLSINLISQNLKLFLTTGILGGLTTFSTFSYETITLFNDSKYLLGSLNLSLNLFLSLGGVVLGKVISHAL